MDRSGIDISARECSSGKARWINAAFGPAASMLALAAALALSGCAGGSEAMTRPVLATPTADLDTARPPPQTVTSAPLLPPVPEAPATPTAPVDTSSTGAASETLRETPPLQYDHLYSDDEQQQIKSDLVSAATKAQKY